VQYNQITNEVNVQFAIQDYLDDLRWANETMHRYEQQLQMSSTEFLALYNQGKLDAGKNMEEKGVVRRLPNQRKARTRDSIA
jgi:hypothetical protein